ncbi:hypothetical protein M5K25_022537 [Dendrobium thyrsiflorum]|uniref:Uncharacterized protein n=1 Tax=Dendrobium thyrsiflorum TaxID=117978 RepID=A0ABD0U6D0_DENTH
MSILDETNPMSLRSLNFDIIKALKCSINDPSFLTCERTRRGSQEKEESSSRLAPPRPPPEFCRTTAKVRPHHQLTSDSCRTTDWRQASARPPGDPQTSAGPPIGPQPDAGPPSDSWTSAGPPLDAGLPPDHCLTPDFPWTTDNSLSDLRRPPTMVFPTSIARRLRSLRPLSNTILPTSITRKWSFRPLSLADNDLFDLRRSPTTVLTTFFANYGSSYKAKKLNFIFLYCRKYSRTQQFGAVSGKMVLARGNFCSNLEEFKNA